MPVPTKRPLVAFLYLLMRDEITPGKVERVLNELKPSLNPDGGWVLSNDHLARYAQEVAEALDDPAEEIPAGGMPFEADTMTHDGTESNDDLPTTE